jgi:TolA-binding protein
VIRRIFGLGLLWVLFVAATPLPLKPPPPDLVSLLPWAQAPLDKPAIALPRLALPPVPAEIPPVALAPLVAPAVPKPMAPLPSPRALPCVGAWLRIASESLECGRAKLSRNELDEALKALDQAVRGGTEPDVLLEARYWYGEALYRAGRLEDADWQFRQVLQQGARSEFAPWAAVGSGWTALRLGDSARAQETFTRLLSGSIPVSVEEWARHGFAMALYGLGRHADAEKIWAQLAGRRPAVVLARDVAFWHGETVARLGQYEQAVRELSVFTQGGSHPLLGVGLVRLGWWSLAAGKPAEAVAAFRTFLAGGPGVMDPTGGREREWADAGLAVALAAAGEWNDVRRALGGLDTRRSALGVPVRLRVLATATESNQSAFAQTLVQELLAGNLPAPVRAWVLLVKGEAHRAEGNRDEARTQYDLARSIDANSETGRQAALRLAQMNFDLREFSQAMNDVAPLVNAPAPDLRAAALLLHGEAAYQAGDYKTALSDYRRALVEFPGQPQARAVQLAMAWTALRQGQRDEALRQFLTFAQAAPNDAQAADALGLASELTLATGNLDAARPLLDRIISTYGGHQQAEFARLNRALLLARTGQPTAQRELQAWITRAPFPPLVGRAAAALGATLLAARRPAEAGREFARAQQEGFTDFARLGLGAVALAEERWDDAKRELTEARDTGTPAVASAADYGLAVVAFNAGAVREFAGPAQAMLDAAPRGPAAPRLLYVLTGIRADDKDWPGALTLAKRLVADFPDDETADDALERVGSGAAQAGAWPVVVEAYTLLRQRYPQSPFAEQARFPLAQALLETGRGDEARRGLEEFVKAAPSDPRTGQAWLALARAREAAGDRSGAMEAFNRASQAGPNVTWSREALLGNARVLSGEQRWDEARAMLEKVLRSSDGPAAGEAAIGIADAWAGQGDHLAAAEYYLTAAYVAPQSAAAPRAMLAAARSLAAAKQSEAAANAYRKVLALSDVPPDVAAAARKALADLRR